MDAARHQRAKSLFLEVRELPADARAAFLAERHGEDPELVEEVSSLLAAEAEAGGAFLERPGGAPASIDHIAGERGYRLLRRLGAGGMGEVWLAERSDGEFRQQVAIKLMQASAALSQEALRRFRAERQILASLQHPNIARLLDGGTLADGTPFLVMEYVAGEPLDAWCRQRGLGLRERVRLFAKVCDAVQAAHQALVVHRDLKPSNILVGADGEPKLLDFGIAKVLATGTPETLVQTRTGMAPMTLAYASPEQVQGAAVATASDVYSLGVVLHELLTGALPYRAALSDPLAVARAVCEEPPELPSRRAADNCAAAQADPALRRASGELRGDLDAILLKALRKEAGERYRSVEHFAADLARWLDGLPVQARRGSRAYAARRFVARHRWAVAAALLFVGLVLGFALDRQRQLLVVQQQRDRAERALGLLGEVLSSANPTVARGEELSAKQILASAARKLVADATIEPGLRFELLLAIAGIEQVLGMTEQVEAHSQTLAELAASLPPPAAERLDLMRLQSLNSERDSAAADSLGAALLARVDAGGSALEAGEVAKVLIARANTLDALGRGGEAEPLLRRALAQLPAGAEEPRLRASVNSQLGQVLQNRGQLAEAEVHLRAALEISLRHAFDPYRISRDQNNLAGLLSMQGRFGEALVLHEDAIARFEQAVGSEHPEYAIRLNNLGSTELGAGRVEAAIGHLRSALELARERYGEGLVHSLALVNLASAQTAAGEFDAAQTRVDTALAALRGKFGLTNLQTVRALRAAGVLALERKDAAAARAAFGDCVDGALQAGIGANPGVGRCRLGLAELALAAGDREGAARMLDEVEASQSALDPRHFERGMTALVRAHWQWQQGQSEAALATLAEIAPEALNEPWQQHWRALLQAAASGRCESGAAAARAALARRHAQGHPRWQRLCAPP